SSYAHPTRQKAGATHQRSPGRSLCHGSGDADDRRSHRPTLQTPCSRTVRLLYMSRVWPSTLRPPAGTQVSIDWLKEARCAVDWVAGSAPPSNDASLRKPKLPDGQQVRGITDCLVRGQPMIEQVPPPFIVFLGTPVTRLLANTA